MRVNQGAIVFWLVCIGIGYLVGSIDGAIIGFLSGVSFSVLVTLL